MSIKDGARHPRAADGGYCRAVSIAYHTRSQGGIHMITSPRSVTGFVLFVSLFAISGLAAAGADGHHGQGYGHGMMGMGGHDMGMMGMGPMHVAGLTDAQREKINRLADENRKKMWQLMGQRMDDQAKLRDLY